MEISPFWIWSVLLLNTCIAITSFVYVRRTYRSKEFIYTMLWLALWTAATAVVVMQLAFLLIPD